MAKGFKHGAGGGNLLNFKVVGGTSAPASPKANDIWINTSTAITSYVFSNTQPTGSEGMIWILTGASSTVKFNALKKNGIEVYPLEVKQYVNNAWVAKTAKSYQGGKWVDWWKGELYIQGNEYSAVTGGNTAWLHMSTSDITSLGTVTKSGGRINIKCATKQAAAVGPVNKINLKDYKTLKLNVVDFSGGIINTRTSLCVSTTRSKTSANDKVAYKDISGTGLITLDVSSLNGEYYVYAEVWCVYVASGAYSMSYDKMYLE